MSDKKKPIKKPKPWYLGTGLAAKAAKLLGDKNKKIETSEAAQELRRQAGEQSKQD